MLLIARCFFLSLVAFLVACGGASDDGGALVAQVTVPGTGSILLLKLTDSTGTVITNNTVGLNSSNFVAQGQVRDSSGVAIPNQLVAFTTDPLYGTFVNGTTTVVPATPTGTQTVSIISALTDATGTVKVQLVGKALGAAFLVAQTKVSSTTVTTSLPYQVTSATTNIPSGLQFSSATPSQLVIATASTGLKQSILKFKVVNELGTGVSSQSVLVSLDSQSIAAGVTFIKDGISSAAPQTIVSGLDGFAQIVVNVGALPTGIIVSASMVSNPTVKASSVGLSVTNGRISQKSMSLSAVSPTIEGFDIDNVATEVTVIATDRLGNPIPEGTVVNFVTSHGLIGTFVVATQTTIVTNTVTGTATTVTTSIISDSKGSCTLNAASLCRVQFKSAGVRPTNGRVTILAYADGEETFIDLNGNNQWDAGEPFTDMGMAYLDVNGNFVYDLGIDQAIPGGKTGTSTCAGTELSIQNTCDGTWSDFIRARQRLTIVWATSRANIRLLGVRSLTSITVTVLDLNGNNMAVGTAVTAAVGGKSACLVGKVIAGSDPATSGLYTITLNGDASCATAVIEVTVTSPSGIQTFQAFN